MNKKKETTNTVAKADRVRAFSRLLYFIFAVGSIGSAVILSMLLSDNEYQVAMNIVAGLNSAAAAFFVLKLIFE